MFNSNIASVIDLKRNMYFKYCKKKFIKYIDINYYYKKIKKSKIKYYTLFYFIFIKIQDITGNIPTFKKINIKVLTKKKILKKSYYIIKDTVFSFIDSFIDFYIIHNMYLNIKLIKNFNKKFYYLQETSKRKFINNFFLKKQEIQFNLEFVLYNIPTKFLKIPYNFNKSKQESKYKSMKMLIHIRSHYKVYFFKLFYIFLSNFNKISLFIYKYFRKKKIKI